MVVPNSNLISNELTNWTLSDQRRRVDINVGVAYGTDPNRVINLLVEVARSQPKILRDPAPDALFIAFGASSLDYTPRAWSMVRDWPLIASELSIAVNNALGEAGIEIPFPQRDLNIRTIHVDAQAALRPSQELLNP